MPTDLNQVYDHPAKLLADRAAQFGDMSLHDAAEFLYAYERSQGVVFAALDKNTLEMVQHEFAQAGSAPTLAQANVHREELAGIVSDLLGLAD